ncbi:type II toxin-antitoxin system RelE/ParE family toxin [Pantoea sp. DY-17]|uniref:type II toxin-antitoxin system RelE/ParE family toxin n=1 Tax=Pantoea sp. DY-17 TaxID=2871490 RepID=UPI001C98B903|nr:type II toxin-antitoxin system RelE/ParE family toxin [Pantoea sp. DY-17]MBY4952090.1 type II toxin-antitoxin system RelE/ParE family toxin [Pantoea sp. DY-17]
MAIYVLKPFDRNTKGDAIDSAKLCKAALEVMAGIYEASFGGGVYKKRIPLVAGKSGGARAVVAFKTEKHLFFVNGYAKSAFKSSGREISESDLALYKEVAKQLFEMSSEQAKVAIKTGKMREVKCDG